MLLHHCFLLLTFAVVRLLKWLPYQVTVWLELESQGVLLQLQLLDRYEYVPIVWKAYC